jgi:hypothetical protein
MPRPLNIPTIDQRHTNTTRRTTRVERRSAGPWHYVGDSGGAISGIADPIAPDWLNGWDNVGGGYVFTRFRWLLGGGLELQLAADFGTAGTTMFTLPLGFYLPGDGLIPGSGHDSSGTYRPFHIDSDTGDVIDGV